MQKSVIFLALILLFLLPLRASAQEKEGITVIPSIEHLDLALDPPQYELTYINNTGTDVTLLLKAQDFTELEDSYRINFLKGKDAENYKYSLSSWITFENKTLQISKGEKKTIKIFVDDKRITKGGHYASIQAEIVQENEPGKINLKAVLSSLLFVRASTGQEIEEGKINLFAPIRDFFDYPLSYILRFNNTGNVHVIPHGTIEVFDPFNNLVSKGVLNEGSLDALPESIRRYDTKVTTYKSILIPGVYSAKISISFGKDQKSLSQSVSFLYLGKAQMLIGTLLLLLLLYFVFYYKRRRGKHE